MAHFRGTLKGQRGEASRLGSKSSGVELRGQTWGQDVVIDLHYDKNTGQDVADIYVVEHGARVLAGTCPVARITLRNDEDSSSDDRKVA